MSAIPLINTNYLNHKIFIIKIKIYENLLNFKNDYCSNLKKLKNTSKKSKNFPYNFKIEKIIFKMIQKMLFVKKIIII